MLLLSRVSAVFRDPKSGQTLFTVYPNDRNCFLDAPEAIRADPLFDLLMADGSVEVVTRESQKKGLELDPTAGTDATGKKTTKSASKKSTSKPAAADAPAAEAEAPETPANPDPAAPSA